MQSPQRQMLEEQIELLQLQIQEQNKREQKLKDLVSTLTDQMQYQRELQNQNDRLTTLNQKLLEGIKQIKSRQQLDLEYYDGETARLKQEINQKMNQNQKISIQFEKRALCYEERIANLESLLERKSGKISNLERKIHEESILRLKQTSQDRAASPYQKVQRQSVRNSQLGASTLRTSYISSRHQGQNNMMAANVSMLTKTRQKDYSRMRKEEIKNQMHAIIKSKREYDMADSHPRGSIASKHNRTTLH